MTITNSNTNTVGTITVSLDLEVSITKRYIKSKFSQRKHTVSMKVNFS